MRSSVNDPPAGGLRAGGLRTGGLRERKKAKTHAAIQAQALRLFAKQGYAQTTIEQIADAAEVSQSTFFRYFPTKEDVVLYDDLDPLLIDAFHAQPPELSALRALRAAMHQVIAEVAPERWRRELERHALIREVPELQAAMLQQVATTIETVTSMVAERTHRQPTDPAVRTLAGALIGVSLSAMMALADDPSTDFIALVDESLEELERGLRL